jgi:hypothetical protein
VYLGRTEEWPFPDWGRGEEGKKKKLTLFTECFNQLSITITITWDIREKRFILAHSFGCFSPSLAGPIAFGPMTRQHDRSAWQSKTTHLMAWKQT